MGPWVLCPVDEDTGLSAHAGSSVRTYNPATPVRGHVAVHLELLAGLSVEEDGVDPTQSVAIHQVLGTVLRVREHPAPCTGKEATSRKHPSSLSARAP